MAAIQGALIVQSDLTVLLDENKEKAAEARELLMQYGDVVKTAGSLHTYRLTPLALWNALSAGATWEGLLEGLELHARYGIPIAAESALRNWGKRFGKLRLEIRDGELLLCGEAELLGLLEGHRVVANWMKCKVGPEEWRLLPECRGLLKQELTKLGYPVLDYAGYHQGEVLDIELRRRTLGSRPFALRPYQAAAVDRFFREGAVHGGSGVVVLPCGAGKTVVGLAALAGVGAAALVLTSSHTAALQWRDELLDKTTLTEDVIGVYSGKQREVAPVTIATYNLLTRRRTGETDYRHMALLTERDWGLIVYDEVHLLPAPVFRMTASIQATRRIGLTATLVREDGCAEDVYSLIGPKLYDMAWRDAEAGGYISAVSCKEIRVPLHVSQREPYHAAGGGGRLRIAAENANKLPIVKKLLREHDGKPTLVIGQYLNQLREIASSLEAPLLTGEVSPQERADLYQRFKDGAIRVLVVSKVANLAVDLPDAAVAIQLSGSFGSRQEEAQRIGRLLRPKATGNQAWFYSIVTDGTKETQFALKRQLFMMEQGYVYDRVSSPDIDAEPVEPGGEAST